MLTRDLAGWSARNTSPAGAFASICGPSPAAGEDFWGVVQTLFAMPHDLQPKARRRAQASLIVARPRESAPSLTIHHTGRRGKITASDIEERFGAARLPGLREGAALLGAGLFAEYEGRDEPANPHRGLYARFAATSNDSVGRGDFGFVNYSLDAHGYLPLGTKRRLLALRLLGIHEPKAA